jgi:hypothetical protein
MINNDDDQIDWISDWGHKVISPAKGVDKTWISQFPLETKGRHILNKFGERFRLIGVNWYGASDTLHVVGGLDVQNLDVICRTVADLGFSVVRLPFSNEMLRTRVVPQKAINYQMNPLLQQKSPLEVFDAVVFGLAQHRVAVIINNHTTYGEFCGPPSGNSLWFDPTGPFSESQWHADWVMMANRYSRCPYVIGYDLRNEIRPRLSVGNLFWPSFRRGSESKPPGRCDWGAASKNAAQRLLKVNPGALIIVERIVWPQGPVNDYVTSPGPLLPEFRGRLVIGVHHYSWSGPGRFIPNWSVPPAWQCCVGLLRVLGLVTKYNYGDMSTQTLEKQIASEWGCLLRDDICPVWVSEFGVDPGLSEEIEWMRRFVPILAKLDVDWAYWPLNVGPKPTCKTDEAYGMIRLDWLPKLPSSDERLNLLEKLGLKMREGAVVPRDQSGMESKKLTISESRDRLRALYAPKDPLLGVKQLPECLPDLTKILGPSKKKRIQSSSSPDLRSMPESSTREKSVKKSFDSEPTLTRYAIGCDSEPTLAKYAVG